MRSLEIAERFSVRPGFRLVDCLEVGLPVYFVKLQVSTLLRKKISPLSEFVMRCIRFGMRECGEISDFLGLQRRLVERVVTGLIQEGNLALSGLEGSQLQALKLTKAGMNALETAETIVPEDQSVPLHFDALLRKPAFYRDRLLKYRELQDDGLKEIPAIPPRQPKPEDFPPLEVQQLTRPLAGLGERRDVVLVRRIEHINRMFRRAVALLYRSLEDNDPYVEFVVDGKLTSEYGNAFTRADGLKLLGIEGSGGTEPAQIQNSAEEVVPEKILVSDVNEIARAQGDLLQAKTALEQCADVNTEDQLRERLKQAEERLAVLESERKKRGVRQIYVYEHPGFLKKAIQSSTERLMIIAPWIKAKVVDKEMMDWLKAAISRGVKVYIGYGMPGDEPEKQLKADREVEERLLRLSQKNPNFTFCRLGDTHAKVLICDSRFCITGSFNWLSYKGDPDRTFRDEQSVLVEIPEHIDSVFRQNWKRFQPQQSKST